MNKNENLKNKQEQQIDEQIKSILDQAFVDKSKIKVVFKDKNNSTLRKYGMQQFGALYLTIERIEAEGRVLIFIDDDGEEGDIAVDDIKEVEIVNN